MNESHPHNTDGMQPADLQADERELAAWFGRLERVEAPQGLRARILAAAGDASPQPAGRLLRFPLGAWGIASAAVLLLALGGAIVIELSDPVEPPGLQGHAAAQAAADAALRTTIREDESLALYHGLETFDEVGLAPGELIADWGR